MFLTIAAGIQLFIYVGTKLMTEVYSWVEIKCQIKTKNKTQPYLIKTLFTCAPYLTIQVAGVV